jgi:hypothetical protein
MECVMRRSQEHQRRVVEIRRSHAAGTHADRRTRRARSRGDARRRAYGEQES